MEKFEITGWVAKTEFNSKAIWHTSFPDSMPRIFKTKGKQSDWNTSDWPPIEVKVTVEKL